jgi:uncharacterized protein DUF3300/endosialidase-like protein
MKTSTTLSTVAALLLVVLRLAAAQAQTPASPPASDQSQQLLKAAELDQLVAPIALYPDALLAEVLMASTYPLEVVQADRWATANKTLKGDQLKAAVDKQSWDDSVKSLAATPSVLAMMSEKLDWTQKLGDAVLAQQPDVMDAVQRLRTKAQANNKLTSTKEQKVSVAQQENKQVIVIEPTVPDTVYVPYYDPAVVYGDWGYPDYPPYYFAPPLGYVPGAILATGIAFGAGYAVGRWASGGNYWGGGVNWGGNNINVNRPVNINNINAGGNNWQHNPAHRQGVKYSSANVQQKFGNNNVRAGSQDRMDFRGRSGEQVIKPGGSGANLGGDKVANRPSTADRTPGRPDASNRPSTGAKVDAKGPAKKGPSGGTPKRDSAMGNIQSGKVANAQAARGRESLGSGGGAAGRVNAGGGGGPRVSAGGSGGGARMSGGGGGGGARMGGGGGRGGGGGGGRRSDINAKHDITLIGRLDNGLGFYRYSYNGSDKSYVGVMAQEVLTIRPDAVVRGRDGYLRVYYDKLGLEFETYDHWVASGARIPSATGMRHAQIQHW